MCIRDRSNTNGMLEATAPPTTMSQSMSWHQPTGNYTTDLSNGGRPAWDFPTPAFSDAQPPAMASGGAPQMRDYRVPSLSQQYGLGNFYMNGGQDFHRSTQA